MLLHCSLDFNEQTVYVYEQCVILEPVYSIS